MKEAWEAAGAGLDQTAPEVHHYRDLKSLCDAALGEPCEWGEVLDAIGIEAAKAIQKRKPIRSWTWVKERALTFRDRRLAGLRAPEAVAQGPPRSFADQQADLIAEARRRALES